MIESKFLAADAEPPWVNAVILFGAFAFILSFALWWWPQAPPRVEPPAIASHCHNLEYGAEPILYTVWSRERGYRPEWNVCPL